MMRSTLGAPFGGTMRGGHQGVESLALSLITPPNFGGGGGICFPSIVVVASAEPNLPVTCCALAGATANPTMANSAAKPRPNLSHRLIRFLRSAGSDLEKKSRARFLGRSVRPKPTDFGILTRSRPACHCQK